jgi:hypothetical protein
MKPKEKPVTHSAPVSAKTDISDPAEIALYRLCLSEDDIEDIRAFEEGLIAAEQELGVVRFG